MAPLRRWFWFRKSCPASTFVWNRNPHGRAFYCELHRGHKGPHVAHDGRTLVSWEQDGTG